MADDRTRRDDSIGEEVSALGERVKGATKDAAGSITGNSRLEREGELENAEGRARQQRNDVMDETDGVPGESVTGRTAASTRGYSAGSGSMREEAAAAAQRAKDAVTNPTGSMLGLNRMADDVVGGSVTSDYTTPTTVGRDRDLVTGIYDSPEHAGHVYRDLTSRHGYRDNDINVLMSDETRRRHFGDVEPGTEFKTGSKAAEGAGIGGATGMSVGAALGGLLAAATSIAIPGIGLIVAGPLAGAIAGAGAGGAAGTLLGALIGAGIPEERAEVYDRGIRAGGIVLGTRARDEAHAVELERDFRTHGGRDVIR